MKKIFIFGFCLLLLVTTTIAIISLEDKIEVMRFYNFGFYRPYGEHGKTFALKSEVEKQVIIIDELKKMDDFNRRLEDTMGYKIIP